MNTFIDLLTEKGFEKITINDIAERANINRGTVYLHYADKFDLLDKCIGDYVDQLLNHCGSSNDFTLNPDAFGHVFEYLEKDFSIYHLLLSNEGVGFFRNRLYEAIAKTLSQLLSFRPENSAFSNDTAIHFLASGFIGVLEWWISSSMPCTVKEVTERLMFLLKPYTNQLVAQINSCS
jgi:AcrR family transcriptional regulator